MADAFALASNAPRSTDALGDAAAEADAEAEADPVTATGRASVSGDARPHPPRAKPTTAHHSPRRRITRRRYSLRSVPWGPVYGAAVATVRVEVVVERSADEVWDAVADVGAVHRRLLPGRVTGVRVDGDTRVLTMPGGSRVTELLLAVDHTLRRMAYAVVDGQRLPLTYHHAAFEVVADGHRSRLVWVTDVLPHGQAPAVRARVERGIVEMKATLEAAGQSGSA